MKKNKKQQTMEKIINTVTQATGINFGQMKDRKPLANVFARYAAMLLLREENYSNVQ
jgi:hypothetical protein